MNTPGRKFRAMLTPVPAKPTTKQTMETSADFLMFFSTIGPANAADMPRKKMASEKPHSTEAGLVWRRSAISCLNTLQQ